MSSSRERFEAWHEEYLKKDIQLHTKWDVWKARDAEVARLVEALRYAVSIIGHPDDAGTKMLVALLREYDGEKRDE